MWKLIATAPRDGTFIRLKVREGVLRKNTEFVGHWQRHDEMPAGGAWFDREGFYLTPGPIYWKPEQGRFQ